MVKRLRKSKSDKDDRKGGRDEIARDVLMHLAAGGAVLAALSISPALLVPVYAHALVKRKFSQRQIANTFYYMKRQGWIDVMGSKGDICIDITPEGRKHIAKSHILNVEPLHEKKWDGKWRLVSYDINMRERQKRNALRLLLKRLGFVQIHKSVWINPYDCRRELEALVDFFRLTGREVRLVIAEDIGEAKHFRRHFNV